MKCRFTPVLWLLGFSLLAIACLEVKAAAPNDRFSDATPLEGTWFEITADNTGATSEPGEPVATSSSLWWRWTAPTNGWLRISTRTSPMPTFFAVFAGDSFSNLALLTTSQWRCQPSSRIQWARLSTEAVIPVGAGVPYRILLDGERDSPGTGAQHQGQLRFQLSFSTLRITFPTPDLNVPFGLPLDVRVDAGGFDGAPAERTLLVDDQPAGPWPQTLRGLAQGYHVLQAMTRDPAGLERFSAPVSLHIRPVNDALQDATEVSGSDAFLEADTRSATREAGEPLHPGGSSGSTVWFRWRAPANGLARVRSLVRRDLAMTVWQGASVTNLALVQANLVDEALDYVPLAETVIPTWPVTIVNVRQGEDYWIQIDDRWQPYIPDPFWACRITELGLGPCTARLSFFPAAAGLLEMRTGYVLKDGPDGQFFVEWSYVCCLTTARPGSVGIEKSSDLVAWTTLWSGESSGVSQVVVIPGDPAARHSYFRLRMPSAGP